MGRTIFVGLNKIKVLCNEEKKIRRKAIFRYEQEARYLGTADFIVRALLQCILRERKLLILQKQYLPRIVHVKLFSPHKKSKFGGAFPFGRRGLFLAGTQIDTGSCTSLIDGCMDGLIDWFIHSSIDFIHWPIVLRLRRDSFSCSS